MSSWLTMNDALLVNRLVGSIRAKYPNLPIHVHSHDTAGISAASMIAAAAAGADVVDVAIDSECFDLSRLLRLKCTLLGMSGLTSQPPMGAVTLALEQTGLGTGIRYADVQALNLYWTQVRMLYSCFEANVRASDSSVFAHEMPGGQYTNLMVCSRLDGPFTFFDNCGTLVPSISTWSGYSMDR
jgi:pyruvate carboxylase